tara:strand:- start:169 stop:1074 length:906 start_codon:yes stop_codon:yes gene_type:complete
MNALFIKLLNPRILKRIYNEKLSEPLIYNLVSIPILLFGDFRTKIYYDLVPRQPYAFGINQAFAIAKEEHVNKIILIEFGVASGAGLFNMSYIASRLSKIYNIDYQIVGFDSGEGMPEPIDYRDHPESYRKGDFPALKLKNSKLPPNTKIFYGDIEDTLKEFHQEIIIQKSKIGFVSIDVDYYSSTRKCLEILKINSENFLSKVPMYFDDINNPDHNQFCGELLAIEEFNKENTKRKICKMTQLRNWRLFKNALFIDQMYFLHIFDHYRRDISFWKNEKQQILSNPYIGVEEKDLIIKDFE